MAKPIIAALRQRADLKESLLHTAQELAHRASIYGVVRISYTYLAAKCHCSRRTALRHIQRLLDLGIIRKTVTWIRGNYCERNQYAFLMHWETGVRPQGSDKGASRLPLHEREKDTSLQEDLAKQRRGLRFYTPGTIGWEATCAKITELEALLKGAAHG